jgi:uncharacterized protein (TIGR02246 family)
MSDTQRYDAQVRMLYQRVLDAWNRDSADEFAAPFADDGVVVGFDGSQQVGRATIAAEIARIFADHATGRYVAKVRSVRSLGSEAAVLHAVAGIVPAGRTDLEPSLNAVQAMVAERSDGEWQIALYQNTPAQFHGRPDLAERLTEELQHEISFDG